MISNLIILTGPDTFRLQERLKFYKTKFQEKYSDGEVQTMEHEQTIHDLENAVLTPNLFGGKRLVITPANFWDTDMFEASEKINFWKKLPEMSEQCTLIICEPKLDKRLKSSKFFLNSDNGKQEVFEELDELNLLKWISAYAEKQGGKIDHHLAGVLMHHCGTSLWVLSKEIEKLITNGETITETLIKNFSISHPSAIIWNFLESLSKKNVQEAIYNFHQLMDSGTSVHEIFPMITREIRIHAQLRNALDRHLTNQQIVSETKLHPFVVQKTLSLTQKFSKKLLEKMYDRLFDIDKKLKTGGIHTSTDDMSEFELAIEKLILEMCE